MDVATTIRYAKTGFITREKRLLKSAERVRQAFGGSVIFSPEGALQFVRRMKARYEFRQEHGS